MSITFTTSAPIEISHVEITEWREDDEGYREVTVSRHATWAEMMTEWSVKQYDNMRFGTRIVEKNPRPELNLANSNAAAFLRAIGVGFDPVYPAGSIDPREMLNALLILDAIEDPGSDTIVTGGDGHAVFYDVGRTPGQFNHYAEQVRVICERAIEDGCEVQWA